MKIKDSTYWEACEVRRIKLGLPQEIMDLKFKPSVENPGETVSYYQFRDSSGKLQYAESLCELEDILDDLLDPSFRQAEAEADARFADRAYGPMD